MRSVVSSVVNVVEKSCNTSFFLEQTRPEMRQVAYASFPGNRISSRLFLAPVRAMVQEHLIQVPARS